MIGITRIHKPQRAEGCATAYVVQIECIAVPGRGPGVRARIRRRGKGQNNRAWELAGDAINAANTCRTAWTGIAGNGHCRVRQAGIDITILSPKLGPRPAIPVTAGDTDGNRVARRIDRLIGGRGHIDIVLITV